jgi:surfactin synthase thioesterase subunit
MTTPDWLYPLRKPTSVTPTARLIVFPYAAAGASALRPIVTRLPETVELLGVGLPGRERRFGEPPATSHPEIVDGITADLRARATRPTYLFGHSMGASLALAMAAAAPQLCQGVVVSARKPIGFAMGAMLGLSDDKIITFLGAVGNTAPKLLADPYWRDRLVQLFRSDTQLDEETTKATEHHQLAVPIVVLGGADDPYVDSTELFGWANRTQGRCDVLILPGEHFFLLDTENHPAIVAALSTALTAHPHGAKEEPWSPPTRPLTKMPCSTGTKAP